MILYSWLAPGDNGTTVEIRTFCLAHHTAILLEGKMTGQTISHYKILEKLGEGEMSSMLPVVLDIFPQAGRPSTVSVTTTMR